MSGGSPKPQSARERGPDSRVAHRYQVVEEIARGGMGVVYRVVDRATGVESALKRTLSQGSQRAAALVASFEREYQVLASLDHPRIIRVFEYGVDAEGPYYTMELLTGGDLTPGPWQQVCLQLRDIASSLSLLHARRLIHRDLSPRNVKITDDGHCKLLDFGALADFGSSTTIVGTPPLVPPEALRGDMLDQRSDLYALGALGYWLLTGEHAFGARHLDDLELLWERPPRPPSQLTSDVPKALDALILSLLSGNPLARPGSAAEVIAKLNTVGQLPLEDERERKRLAASFLIVPPFVGRKTELAQLQTQLENACGGHGRGVRIEATGGAGCSRLLEEVGLRAQIAGATVLRADASMHPSHLGTVRALALRLLDALPDVALACARSGGLTASLAALGRELEGRVDKSPSRPTRGSSPVDGAHSIDEWFVAVSRHKPLVIEIDNVSYCDDGSLGFCVQLSQRASHAPILLVVADRVSREPVVVKGLTLLREQCEAIPLENLEAAETLALTRSLFGDAPNVERFAEWLHGRTAGSPLHIVEISRQLVAQEVLQHEAGMWVLPASRPQVELPDALEDTLAMRLRGLAPRALALAQSLSLQRREPTLELCQTLVRDGGTAARDDALVLLAQLAEADVVVREQGSYRFTSSALRDALLSGMTELERETSHQRLGLAFSTLARKTDLALRIEAGWHFMQGGEALRGADMVAHVMSDGWAIRNLSADSYPIGPVSAAALAVYNRHRRSAYERLPLLAAVADAAFFEELRWSDVYADEALDVMDDVSGMRLARRLRRFVGAWLSLGLAIVLAALRFVCAPKRERVYSFMELINQTASTVVSLVAAATISLDSERAPRIAHVLSPFACLPQRDTGRGVYEFVFWMVEIGREHPAQAFVASDRMTKRFSDRRWYRMLPDDGRSMFVTGAHFMRGAFAVFRASGQAALESAVELENSGLKIYSMIASQLRFLYHINRGELALARPHRERVEQHAAHVGSAWQVELWEDAALLPYYVVTGDVVELARVVRRFDELVQLAPALALYRRLAELALRFVGEHFSSQDIEAGVREVEIRPPRSFLGWSMVLSVIAAAHNAAGRHREARAFCERALVTMTNDDREYVTLFLPLDLQTALADAGLGDVAGAFARVDGLLTRLTPSGHPLALGLLHECRAHLAHNAGREQEFEESVEQCGFWFRGTGTPALIAKAERLEALGRASDTLGPRRVLVGLSSSAKQRAPEGELDLTAETEVGPRLPTEE